MNKSALKKDLGTYVKIRPMAKRFIGESGPQLPPVDDDWLVQEVADDRVRISNTATWHWTILGCDHIHHFTSDPARGAGYGFLILNVQIHVGGNRLWIEPTFRPGEALPDQFGNVQQWQRDADRAYVSRLGFTQR